MNKLRKPFFALVLLISLSCDPATAGNWMTPYESLIENGQLSEVLTRAKAVRDKKKTVPEAWLEYAFIANACGFVSEAHDAYTYYARQFPQETKVKFALKRAQKLQSELKKFPETVAQNLSADDYCLVDRISSTSLRLRWSKEKMPLKVFYLVEPGLDAAVYRNAVLEALKAWTQGSNNLVSFLMVSEKEKADIDIFFTADVNNEHIVGSAGNTRYKSDQRQLKKASIVVLTTDHYTGKPRPLAKTARTITHELGHALGLGHSKDPADLMYFAGNWAGTGAPPSERDLRILNLLYKTDNKELLERVISAITKASDESCPMLVKMYEFVGEDFYQSQNQSEALAWFEKADRLAARLKQPDEKANSRRVWFLSSINYKLKNYAAAVPYYQRYLALCDPKDPKRVSVERILAWCKGHGDKGESGSVQTASDQASHQTETATVGDTIETESRETTSDTAGGAEGESSGN